MILIATHIIPVLKGEIRLSDYVREAFPDLVSRNAAKKAIKTGAIQVNGKQAETGLWVRPGMRMDWYDLLPTPPKSYDLSLEIVHEDDHLAIVYKPAGLRVSGPQYRTLLNALPPNLLPSSASDALSWPRPVHRLDRATQGLVIIAKTRRAQVAFTQMFEAREIEKHYLALVMGATPAEGILENPIEQKAARTTFKELKRARSIKNEWVTLLEASPHTGRTHQLRIHLSDAGFPILGDPLYGPEGHILKHKGLFLAAIKLAFKHPITTKQLEITVDPPAKFLKRMEREEHMWVRAQEGMD